MFKKQQDTKSGKPRFVDAEEISVDSSIAFKWELSKQLDRITKAYTMCLYNFFENGVEALEVLMTPYLDDTYNSEVKKTDDEIKEKLLSTHKDKRLSEEEYQICQKALRKWKALMRLIGREGFLPKRTMTDVVEREETIEEKGEGDTNE